MAIYPEALWLPLPEANDQPLINPTQSIGHTAVDAPGSTDLQRYFARLDIKVESHFWVPKGKYRKPLVQMISTGRQADANRFANPRAISWEVEDEGNPEGEPMDDWQLEQIIVGHLWLNEAHDIPPVLIPEWDKPGIGYHSQFGFADPINKIGIKDNPWSVNRGKVCPGKARTLQWINIVIPEVASRLGAPAHQPLLPSKLDKVSPMTNPPLNLPPIVDQLNDPAAGGAWVLCIDGSVYTFGGARFGMPYLTGVNGKEYWGDRRAARFEAWNDETKSKVGRDASGTPVGDYHRFLIVSSAGEEYGHEGF